MSAIYLKEWDDVRGHFPEGGDLLVADGCAELRHDVDDVGGVVLEVEHALLRLLADQLHVQFPETGPDLNHLFKTFPKIP